MQDALKTLAQRIKYLRARKGISQEDFADLCGLHRTAIGQIEQAKHSPRFDTLLIISQALDITLSELLKGVEQNGP